MVKGPSPESRLRAKLFLLAVWGGIANCGAAQPSIHIEGADAALTANLQAGLSLSGESCTSPQWRVRQLFERADGELEQAARALGYYEIKIHKELKVGDACWEARFQVEPGPPVLIDQVDLRVSGAADQDPQFRAITRSPGLAPGNRLNHGRYDALKRRIEDLALERGYLDGHFTLAELRVDPAKRRAEVELHYDSGARYRIGTVKLVQDSYDKRILKRFVTVKPGDPYDSKALIALQRSLSGSGYFASVDVRPDLRRNPQRQVPVEVRLQAPKRLAYRFGIGAATDTGPRLSAGFEDRRINALGHRFKTALQLSKTNSSLGAEYSFPVDGPHVDQLGLGLKVAHTDTDTSKSDSLSLQARLTGQRAGWTVNRHIEWISDQSTIAGKTQAVTLLVPGIGWSRTEADDPVYPSHGWRLSLDLRAATSAVLSDASLLQAHGQAKWIGSVGKGRVIARTELGATESADFTRLPASFRFFAGGDQSVRGYAYQALGPKDAEGNVVGGRYLAVGSLEYEHPVVGDWSAAGFVDVGNAFDGAQDRPKCSVGIGARWRSPVGPLRIDLAFPVADPQADLVRLHFSMGPDL